MKVGVTKAIRPLPALGQAGASAVSITASQPDLQKLYYQDKFEKHPVLPPSISSQIGKFVATPFSQDSGSYARSTQTGEEDYSVGPGWWGQGVTMQRAQADLADFSIAGDPGERAKSLFQGPSYTTGANDPNENMITLAKGGEGTGAYNVTVGGGLSVGNIEERAYNLFYGGSSQGGVANFQAPDVGYGIGGGSGIQARADVADADVQANVNAGTTSIGGKNIGNLVSAGGIAQGSVGAQGGAEGMAYVGHQGVGFGEGISAFAGAQAGLFGQASVDGVGVGVLGQVWAGEGAKENLSLSLKHGVLSFDGGLGAAIDAGGYFKVQATVNFNQIAQELEGIANAGDTLGAKWSAKAGEAGQLAGDVVGAAHGAAKLGASTGETIVNTGADAAEGLSEDLLHGVESAWKKA